MYGSKPAEHLENSQNKTFVIFPEILMLNHLMFANWFKFIQSEVKHWQLWSFGFNVRPWLWLGNGEEGGPTLPLASTREKLRAPRSPLALPPGLGMARKLYRKQGGLVARGKMAQKGPKGVFFQNFVCMPTHLGI